MINGISWLVVTKLDVLDELAEIPVCVDYLVDGKKTVEIPAQASGYDKLECVYHKMPGWRTSTQGIQKFENLPKAAREYLAFVEKETGAKIGMISTGPDRDQIIFMDEFAAAMKTAHPEKSSLDFPLVRRRDYVTTTSRGKERTMVVLAVTWMAKAGHDADVAPILREADGRIPQGARLPDVPGASAQDRTAALLYLRAVQRRCRARSPPRFASHFLQYARKELPKVADRVEGHLYEPVG